MEDGQAVSWANAAEWLLKARSVRMLIINPMLAKAKRRSSRH